MRASWKIETEQGRYLYCFCPECSMPLRGSRKTDWLWCANKRCSFATTKGRFCRENKAIDIKPSSPAIDERDNRIKMLLRKVFV